MVRLSTARENQRVVRTPLPTLMMGFVFAAFVTLALQAGAFAQAARMVDGKMQIDLTSERAKASLAPTTEASKLKIKAQAYLPLYFPLVHPSPRNKVWHKKNPWFEEKVVPELQKTIALILSN